MYRKRQIMMLILLMVVGFAAVSTILTINGTISILADQEAFARDVVFTKAKIKGGSAVIEDEGKSITFVSPTIRELDEEAILNFTITNYNRQYDAEATIKCDFVEDDTLLGEDFSEYIDVKTDEEVYFIPASGNTPGQVISKIKKVYTGSEDQEVKIECQLIVEGKSKDYLADELVRSNPDNTIKNVPNNYNDEFWAYKTEITNIVFENELNPHTGDNVEEYNISESGDGTVIAYYDKDEKTVYIQGDGNIFANKDSSYLFSNFTNLETMDGLALLDTSQVTNMNSMFSSSSSLTSLTGIGTWDISNVTSMTFMFRDCAKLINLDLTNWDISSVTDMSYMFYNCSVLESVGDLSLWDTSSVTNMSSMFYKCSVLASLGDLSSWDTSQVTNMFSMFSGCSSLESVGNLNSWDTSSVTTIQSMFENCSSLTSVGDLSSWNTSSVIRMYGMFDGCSSLESLDGIGNWDTSKVISMGRMFYSCTKLTSLDLSKWDTSNVTDMPWMFDGLSSLKSVGDISSWDISQVTYVQSMFQDSPKINTTISITANNINNINGYPYMFKGTATEEGAGIIVNYTEENKSLVEELIKTKSDNSKVSLGSVIQYYNVTTNDDDIIVTSNASKNYVNVKITLTSQSGKEIVSFKANGTLIKGNSFKMPNNDVTITDVVTK